MPPRLVGFSVGVLLAVALLDLLPEAAELLGPHRAILLAVVLAGLDQRRRELAILRANGARPRDIFLLLPWKAAPSPWPAPSR